MRLCADYRLKVAHDAWIWVRSNRRADQVKGGFHVGNPVTDSFIDGIFQGAAATGNRAHLRSQQLHTEDIERLTLHIQLAHVDNALQAKHGTDSCGGDPVLPCASFSDDALLAHTPG